MKAKNIALLGSTGSIGTQTLDILRQQPDLLKVSVLTANQNADLLIEQALEFQPDLVVIADEGKYKKVRDALSHKDIKVKAGSDALEECVTPQEIDMVLTALVGFAGLKPTVAAIRAGKDLALANKETLVVAGQIIMELARIHKTNIIPVDSEHSALFQCMVGESADSVDKMTLTASGGPFRGYSLEQLKRVTLAQALKHPNWEMGAKITIDSATMMNKGLEVIEAKWLFDLTAEQIEIVVHPQSIIHSMVQFKDGSIKAQMGLPDMRVPIHYALCYPERVENNIPRFNFTDYPSLTFEQIDTDVFKNLKLAFVAMDKGGNLPCILNAANEISNQAFRDGKITFTQITELNEAALNSVNYNPNPGLKALEESDAKARAWLKEQI